MDVYIKIIDLQFKKKLKNIPKNINLISNIIFNCIYNPFLLNANNIS